MKIQEEVNLIIHLLVLQVPPYRRSVKYRKKKNTNYLPNKEDRFGVYVRAEGGTHVHTEA